MFLLATNLISAQVSTNIESQKTFGGNQNDFMTSGLKLSNGDFIYSGWSYSPPSSEKTSTNHGENDFWIISYNSSDLFQWDISIGGNLMDGSYSMIETSDGNILLGGFSNSPISGNKTSTHYGENDFFLTKIDVSGNILWQNSYGGTNQDYLNSIIELSTGELILAGTSNSNISGVKTENSRGSNDFWIIKTDENGVIIWDKTIGGAQSDNLYEVTLDENDNIYLFGSSLSSISGEKTENNYGSIDNWIVKLNSDGTILWDKTVGGSSTELGGGIELFNSNLYVITGSISNTSGLKTEDSRGDFDFWVYKLDLDGNFIFDKTIGGNGLDGSPFIKSTPFDNLLIGGSSNSSISGEKEHNNIGLRDYWALEIDTNAVILWQRTIGGTSINELTEAIIQSPNEIRLIGQSDSNISGDKNENSRGGFDFWIVDLSTTLNIEELNGVISLTIFPNPTTESIQLSDNLTSEEQYHLIIFDQSGRKVYEKSDFSLSEKITVNSFDTGIYSVVLSSGKKVFSASFVKN